MLNVYIQYNPYTVETIIEVDGKNLMKNGKLSKYKNERLQVWIHELLPVLVEELNEDHIHICFKGTLLDYEDLYEACQSFSSISIEHIPAKESTDKIEELKALVEHMQSGPFESLRNKKVKENFYKALNSEFEIAVIATMSSGKSTLINALLGRELMPSKNEACTATIARIKNVPGRPNFSAICYDADGKEIASKENVTYEDMDAFNSNQAVSVIEVEGYIPSISSKKMNLVLVDTPGPNNSVDTSHREHTYRVIKDEDKPLVLYVLNGTQLHTDDDYFLLNSVAEAMKVGGKQSKDRFIFAVNKADEFDPEKGEDLRGVLERVKKYLEKHGIENPNIYPISAETAKVIRMHQNGCDLTRHQRKTLNSIDLFIEEPIMHLEQYAPLSPSLKNAIADQVMLARDNQDLYTEALYHSGVPSVEAAINEYLDKYAVTSKITNAVNSFKKIVEREQMMQNLQDEMAKDEKKRQEIHRQVERIEQEIEQGEKAKQFKEKISAIDVNLDEHFEKVRRKIFQEKLQKVADKFRNERIPKYKAEAMLFAVKREIEALESDAITDLEKIITNVLRANAQKYIDEYRMHVQDILNSSDDQGVTWMPVEFFSTDLPDVEELIDGYTYTEKEWVGTRTVKNPNKKWYKPWTWFKDSYIEEDVYEHVEYVDMKTIRERFLGPVKFSLEENFSNAKDHAEEEKIKLKEYFISQINRLEEEMKKRVEEIKRLASHSEELKKRISENEKKKQWLDDFVARLDTILDI
ncbi:dynamin family protein [Caldibacillus thermoamylovorans]